MAYRQPSKKKSGHLSFVAEPTVTSYEKSKGKSNADKYREISRDWNHGTSRRLPSVPVLDSLNFKCLIFVAYNHARTRIYMEVRVYLVSRPASYNSESN
jgi:hypothetical protein